MVVLDTDVFSQILRGTRAIAARADSMPASEQAITVVTAEELLRGRLGRVREAQSRRDAAALVRAYHWLAITLVQLTSVAILRDSEAAEKQFAAWQAAKVRVRPNDLRIAAMAHTSGATLITSNRKDFDLVPGLDVEFWAGV